MWCSGRGWGTGYETGTASRDPPSCAYAMDRHGRFHAPGARAGMVIALWRLSPLCKMVLLCSNAMTKALPTAALRSVRGIAMGELALVAVRVSVGVMVGGYYKRAISTTQVRVILIAIPTMIYPHHCI